MLNAEPMRENIPEWDLGDRLRKGLRHAGISSTEMADYLRVARETVSTWTNGRIRPSKQTLMLWALKTGVPLDWYTPRDLNPEPTDSGDGGELISIDLAPSLRRLLPSVGGEAA